MNLQTNKPLYKIYIDAISRAVFLTDYVVSGLTPSIPATGLTVNVAAGAAYTNAATFAVTSGSTTLSAADATNPRRDIVYITSAGAIANTAGTPAASNPLPPALAASAVLIAVIEVAANQATLATADMTDARLGSGGTKLTRYAAGNSGTALTIDWNNGDTQTVTLTGNCTFTFSNPVEGRKYTLRLKQDATGSRTATWPAAARWSGGTAPTLTTTASKVDYIGFYYDATDAKYDGVASALNF